MTNERQVVFQLAERHLCGFSKYVTPVVYKWDLLSGKLPNLQGGGMRVGGGGWRGRGGGGGGGLPRRLLP